MDDSSNIRQRARSSKPNGIIEHREEKKQEPEFTHRESPLTVLITTSLHIRAIYHIFVVILVVLLFDTVIYDIVEHGKPHPVYDIKIFTIMAGSVSDVSKYGYNILCAHDRIVMFVTGARINVAISTVAYGFGDIGRCAKLWLFEFSIALIFYPGLLFYAAGARLLKNNSGLSRIWKGLGIAGVAGLQAALVIVPVWDLGRKHLALASGVTVTCEMFRFAMKIHAAAIACGPRWSDPRTLPTCKHYLYYLVAPTLIYRDQYPRTKKIRWGSVIFYFLEVAAIIFYNSFLWERFILPYWSDYGKESKVDAGTVVRGMFACVLPGVISFLCGFYCVLHAWLNAFAEMLKFADRLFYDAWWTTSQFSKYYRAWNRVVHSWLRDHIYLPLVPVLGRAGGVFMVFFISAAAHEVILSLSFGFFYPVLMMQFGVLGMLLIPITATSGRRYPSFMNFLMWLSFFFGNGILWSLYPMEYFARKNCPPSENDSFFVPKSWTCPEIVLKPNWTFQNPFQAV